MFCTQCGKSIPDNAKFCDGCGAQIGATAQPQQTTYTQQPQQPTYIQQPQQAAYIQQPVQKPVYQQPVYQQPTCSPSSLLIKDFAEKANSIKVLGIIATVLCFGIGFIFSIIIMVKSSGLTAPAVIPENPYDAAQLEKAKKDFNLGKKLAAIPFIALGLCFIIGFFGGVLAYL